jgi:uncharacterized membrane protein (UPF0127 family)
MVVNLKFNYQDRKIEMDVEVCGSILSQISGLMFKKNSKPLFFVFKNKKKRPIHSYFCVPFYAIWFNGDEIVDEMLIEDRKFSIKPLKEFDRLLEIPKNSKEFCVFVDDKRKV